jgi:chorismate mutase
MIEGERRGGVIQLGELRIKLDQMTERITSRFKDRLRFPFNSPIYQPDKIPIVGRSNISLLQFAIEGLESYHASLGRYSYFDQHPVLGLNLPSPSVERPTNQLQLPKLDINIGNNLLSFYPNLISKYCKFSDDPNSYGETAYIDADLIQMIHERVNIGRYVADVKGKNNPEIYQAKSNEELLIKLKDQPREKVLIDKARNIATTYELNPDMIEEAFKWIIDQTLDIEIKYIQQIGRVDGKEPKEEK